MVGVRLFNERWYFSCVQARRYDCGKWRGAAKQWLASVDARALSPEVGHEVWWSIPAVEWSTQWSSGWCCLSLDDIFRLF